MTSASVVAGIRERYDGRMRNPWNEFECGSNYARSMASYALIPILSGFTFDMTEGRIGFAPLPGMPTPFCTFWSVGEAWGLLELDAVSAPAGAGRHAAAAPPGLPESRTTPQPAGGHPVAPGRRGWPLPHRRSDDDRRRDRPSGD